MNEALISLTIPLLAWSVLSWTDRRQIVEGTRGRSVMTNNVCGWIIVRFERKKRYADNEEEEMEGSDIGPCIYMHLG